MAEVRAIGQFPEDFIDKHSMGKKFRLSNDQSSPGQEQQLTRNLCCYEPEDFLEYSNELQLTGREDIAIPHSSVSHNHTRCPIFEGKAPRFQNRDRCHRLQNPAPCDSPTSKHVYSRITRKYKTKELERIQIDTWKQVFSEESLFFRHPKISIFQSFISIAREFLPKRVVEVLFLFIYIMAYYASFKVFCSFINIGDYIFLQAHLEIHEKANSQNMEIKMSANTFKGFTMVYLGQVWCDHCVQRVNARIALKLLETYRREYKQMPKPI